MSLDRRKFLKLSSVTAACLPFSGITGDTIYFNSCVSSADALFKGFQNPQGTAKPFVRWWWNGLRVVKEEIVRELDMLKKLGIGGVEINSIRFPETADPMNYKELEWLDNDWVEMLAFAVNEAKKRGLVCDIIMGSGWPFGGQFLTREEQSQLMALETLDLKGPQTLQISKEALLKKTNPPLSSKYDNPLKTLRVMRLAPADLQSLEEVVDLDHLVSQNEFSINIPQGDFVLYYLVNITGFQAVLQGAPGANGPVLNHFNKTAVQRYINRMSDAVRPKMGKLGNSFRSVFVDSLELEGANWCNDMWEEFEKRRKYSLKPFLPFILFKTGRMGRALNEKYGAKVSAALSQTLERVRYDFEITKHELFQERFIAPFLNWCKENGVQSRVQAYGREYHPSDSSMQIDIPEGETWIRSHIGEDLKEFNYMQGRSYSQINKFVSSGARLAGKRIVSCEEITNTEVVFNATLERIKITGDQSNISGISHSILHGFNYSPPKAAFPGWIRYGTWFNERNTWWPYLKNWINYKTRLSYLFQAGELVSDIAVMHPLADLWSRYAAPWDPFPEVAYPDYVHNVWEAIHQCGSGVDFISEHIMQNAGEKEGMLTYGKRQYKALIVIAVTTLQPETANAFKRFADKGGTLIFIDTMPSKSAGWYRHAEGDKYVTDEINSLKNRKNVIRYPAPTREQGIIQWYKGLQSKAGLKPYMHTDNPQSSVSQNYYKVSDADVFFISNYNLNKRYHFNAEFAVAAHKKAWLWDLETGKRYAYPAKENNNRLQITLAPAESKLIVFDGTTTGERYREIDVSTPKLTLKGSWKLSLNYIDGVKKEMVLDKLVDFSTHEPLKSFGGTVLYKTTFNNDTLSTLTYLNLGKVIGVSELYLNGKLLGSRWYGDHIYPLDRNLQPGKNHLSIKLTTTLGNYMSAHPENKDAEKWILKKKQPLYSMGVLGPVTLG